MRDLGDELVPWFRAQYEPVESSVRQSFCSVVWFEHGGDATCEPSVAACLASFAETSSDGTAFWTDHAHAVPDCDPSVSVDDVVQCYADLVAHYRDMPPITCENVNSESQGVFYAAPEPCTPFVGDSACVFLGSES